MSTIRKLWTRGMLVGLLTTALFSISNYIENRTERYLEFFERGIFTYRGMNCEVVRDYSIPGQGIQALIAKVNEYKLDKADLQILTPVFNTLREMSWGRLENLVSGRVKVTDEPTRHILEGREYPVPKCTTKEY